MTISTAPDTPVGGSGEDQGGSALCSTRFITCVALPTKPKMRFQPTTANVIETESWSNPTPHHSFGSFTTLRSFAGAVLYIHKSTPRPAVNQVAIQYSMICTWFGLCRARIGEIRCTAATQFHPLRSRYVSSSNRSTSLGNVYGHRQGENTLTKSPPRSSVCSCIQVGKLFQGGALGDFHHRRPRSA